MTTKLDVVITENNTTITFEKEQGVIHVVETEDRKSTVEQPTIYFLLKDTALVSIGIADANTVYNEVAFNKVMLLSMPWDIDLIYMEQLFISSAQDKGVELVAVVEESKVPTNYEKIGTRYKEELLFVLGKLGYSLFKKNENKKAKAEPAKARHKWTKEVGEIEFYIRSRESEATVMWHKRNEMLIKAGAKMMKTYPLNKDGSIGFSAKLGEKIRSDHADKIKDFVTTEDITLKSVNEVGIFLYYGGTNGWLEMMDKDGKTINEWTVVG